jgi:DNA-binding transcriptional regulator WhiA
MNTKSIETTIKGFYRYYIQLKSFHFFTNNYNHHKIVDEYLEKYNELYDKFIEVIFGSYGKIDDMKNYNLKIVTINDENILLHVDAFLEFIIDLREFYRGNGVLLTLCDEIQLETTKLVYLLKI